MPYREFVTCVFAGAAGDAEPLSLTLPQSNAPAQSTASMTKPSSFQEQVGLLKGRLLRLTAGPGKDVAESLAALAARIEEHEGKGAQARPSGRRGAPMTSSYVHEAFACYDVDGSGCLDVQELAALAKELGVAMDKSELERTFRAIDTAGDNRITFPEFCAFMSASEVTGSISQNLRLKLWNRKFDRAAKAMKQAMKKHENKGKHKSEADEAGELVLRIGDPMVEPPLHLKAVLNFEAEAPKEPENGNDVEPPQSVFTLRLRLAPPGGLQEKAAEMNDFLQELVEGPPPGWESATVQPVDGSDAVEVSLTVNLPTPQMGRLTEASSVLSMLGSIQGTVEVDVGSALDLKRLARATAEEPYDIAADARLTARVSAKTSDTDFMNEVGMFILAKDGRMPDEDEPEKEWPEPVRFMKYVLPEVLKAASTTKGTVELGTAAPLIGALCDCRGFGQNLPGRLGDNYVDEWLPDLRRATAADIRKALLNFWVEAAKNERGSLGLLSYGDSKVSKLEEHKWEYWSAILTLRTLLTVIGFARGATLEVTTSLGHVSVEADLVGLAGLSTFVPSYAELRRHLEAHDAKSA